MRRELGSRITGYEHTGTLTLAAAVLVAVVGMAACRDSNVKPPGVTGQQPSAQSAPVATPETTQVASAVDSGAIQPVSYTDAESAYSTRHYVQAAAMFTTYTEQHPQNPWGFYMLGLSAWKAGQPVQAESAFVAALSMDPKHVKSMLNLSRVLLETNRPTDAMDRVEAALALDPQSNEAYRLLGRAQYEMADVDGAIDAYRKAIALDSTDAWSMNNLGLILIQQGRFADALGPLARATQLDSTTAVFQNNLGIALEQTGHYAASAAAYRAALAADSSYEKASVSLARVDGRPEDPGTEPVDLAMVAQDFASQMANWRDSAATNAMTTPAAADSTTPHDSASIGTGAVGTGTKTVPAVKKPE
ncbi:MAG TPA: tetratricopeptide repeat protein [Gemmatimonadaceae bacterium]|nr:tetratricopeptide repeat protein [Gemmatimonadaceae bacterium]